MRRVSINGLEHASERQTRDTTGLKPGLPFDPQSVLDAKAFIRAELADDGIPFASIDERVDPVEGGDNQVDVTLDVTEGQRVTVAQIDFTGNQQLTEDELRGAMDTKREGFWWFRSGSYDDAKFQTDLSDNLPALYRSHGFLDFQVQSDTLIVDPQTGKARVEVAVDEGPQYRLASFSIEGNTRFDSLQLEGLFRHEEGGLLHSLGIGGRRGAGTGGGGLRRRGLQRGDRHRAPAVRERGLPLRADQPDRDAPHLGGRRPADGGRELADPGGTAGDRQPRLRGRQRLHVRVGGAGPDRDPPRRRILPGPGAAQLSEHLVSRLLRVAHAGAGHQAARQRRRGHHVPREGEADRLDQLRDVGRRGRGAVGLPRLRAAEPLRPGQVGKPPLGLRAVPEQLRAELLGSGALPEPGLGIALALQLPGPLLPVLDRAAQAPRNQPPFRRSLARRSR